MAVRGGRFEGVVGVGGFVSGEFVVTTARAVDLAASTSDAVRELNHLTQHRDALRSPAEVDRVVAELSAMAARLPQLLRQLGGWLNAEQDDGRVRSDNPAAPGLIISWADSGLLAAARAADALGVELDAAHQHLSHLGAAEPRTRVVAGSGHPAHDGRGGPNAG